MTDDPAPERAITKLAWPFPPSVIQSNPSGGGTYVAHPIVEQRLIDVLGHPPVTSLIEVVRGYVDAKPPNPNGKSAKAKAGYPALTNAVVGVVLRMQAVIDGELVVVEEVGDCEDPHNWPHDGARAKDAFSDAYKRCAMRLGVGLHLWVKEPQKNYYLHRKLHAAEYEGVLDPAGSEVPDVPPIDDRTPIAHEADDSGPTASSEPPPRTDAPPKEVEAPAAALPAADIDALVHEFGVTKATIIMCARDVAGTFNVKKPLKADDINPAHLPELRRALAVHLEERDAEPAPA